MRRRLGRGAAPGGGWLCRGWLAGVRLARGGCSCRWRGQVQAAHMVVPEGRNKACAGMSGMNGVHERRAMGVAPAVQLRRSSRLPAWAQTSANRFSVLFSFSSPFFRFLFANRLKRSSRASPDPPSVPPQARSKSTLCTILPSGTSSAATTRRVRFLQQQRAVLLH